MLLDVFHVVVMFQVSHAVFLFLPANSERVSSQHMMQRVSIIVWKTSSCNKVHKHDTVMFPSINIQPELLHM